MAFADGRMFWSYQAANLARLGLWAMLGGRMAGGLQPQAQARVR